MHAPSAAGSTRRENMEKYLGLHLRGPAPKITGDRAKRLRERALMLGDNVERLATLTAVPGAVGCYLHAHRLSRDAVCWPAFAGLDWQAQGDADCGARRRERRFNRHYRAFCGIAEPTA